MADAAAHPRALEGSAALIWEALTPPATEAEVTERVAASAGVAVGVVAADVHAFLVLLESRGLIERRSQPFQTIGNRPSSGGRPSARRHPRRTLPVLPAPAASALRSPCSRTAR
nr:PqqD family peptide modification chaperone [Microbacterium ureisolvens]